MTHDREAISLVARRYLDGLYEGDADKLGDVFHPTSALTWEEDGALVAMPRDEWLGFVATRPSAKARGLSRHDEIVQIDQSSQTSAFVKLKCAVPPNFYTDYLCLLKTDGKWQIAQKIFATEVRT